MREASVGRLYSKHVGEIDFYSPLRLPRPLKSGNQLRMSEGVSKCGYVCAKGVTLSRIRKRVVVIQSRTPPLMLMDIVVERLVALVWRRPPHPKNARDTETPTLFLGPSGYCRCLGCLKTCECIAMLCPRRVTS